MGKLIYLSQGKVTQVSDEDFAELSKFNWYALKIKEKFYAARKVGGRQNRQTILMHRQISQAPANMLVDHKDKDGLNNTRENLRVTDYFGNARNKSSSLGSSSKYLGVYWDNSRCKWVARCNGVFLGRFSLEIEAAKAYDAFAIKVFGEFASLNLGER